MVQRFADRIETLKRLSNCLMEPDKEYPRGFVRDYLRSVKMPYGLVDKICRLIPQGHIGKDFDPNAKPESTGGTGDVTTYKV